VKDGQFSGTSQSPTLSLTLSYLAATSITTGAAAEAAAERKTSKYAALMPHHLFGPIAIETFGTICAEGQSVIRDIGKRISAATSYPRETACLFQRISTAIQRYMYCHLFCRHLPMSLQRQSQLDIFVSLISKPLGN
jgi:hypothetical protein